MYHLLWHIRLVEQPFGANTTVHAKSGVGNKGVEQTSQYGPHTTKRARASVDGYPLLCSKPFMCKSSTATQPAAAMDDPRWLIPATIFELFTLKEIAPREQTRLHSSAHSLRSILVHSIAVLRLNSPLSHLNKKCNQPLELPVYMTREPEPGPY